MGSFHCPDSYAFSSHAVIIHYFNRRRAIMMSMGNFNRDRGSSNRPMHKTVCSKCNKECEVPFIPSGSRPVFCKDCFQNNRASDPRRSNFGDRGSRQDFPRPERSNFRAPNFDQNKNQLDSINTKLDKILRILEPKIPETPKVAKVPKVKKATKKPTSHPHVI